MKIHIGLPERRRRNLGSDWTVFPESSRSSKILTIVFIYFAITIIYVTYVVVISKAFGSRPPAIINMIFSSKIMYIAPLFLLMVLLHEIVHMVFFPNFPNMENCVVGVWPARGIAFVSTEAEMSRNRLIGIHLAPLCIISIIPLSIIPMLPMDLNLIHLLAMLNAYCCIFDIYGSLELLRKMPREAILAIDGTRWFYRIPNKDNSVSETNKGDKFKFKFKYGVLLWGGIASLIYILILAIFFSHTISAIGYFIIIACYMVTGYFVVGEFFWWLINKRRNKSR